jgi:hypothetical protein
MKYVEKYSRAGQDTDDKIIRRMRIACWIPKATNTHSEYVILIAGPMQQWLHESVSMLRCAYITCLVLSSCTRITTYLNACSDLKNTLQRSKDCQKP